MSVKDEILKKLEETYAKGFAPKMIIVSPKALAELLSDPSFVDASRYGPFESLTTGEIEKFCGCKIIVSNDISSLTDQLMEENENPSSRFTLKKKDIVIISDPK